jgi:hypothetical protein
VPEEPINGLIFDELVFNALNDESKRHGRDHSMKLSVAEKDLGIGDDQILRAINLIRAKGYPVISTITRRTKEDGFTIPQTESGYLMWRDQLIDDLKSLCALLKLCDAGAKAKFGVDLPTQELMF